MIQAFHGKTSISNFFSLSGRETPFLSALSIKASVVAVFVCEAAPAPEEEAAGMRSALEYLQKLDKYYSQIARPR